MFTVMTTIGGIVLVVLVWLSVLRTTVVPSRSSSRMARWTMWVTAGTCVAIARRLPSRRHERVMGLCAPLGLSAMVVGWLAGLTAGFALVAVATDGVAAVLVATATVSAGLVIAAFAAHLTDLMAAYHDRERLVGRSASRMRVATDADALTVERLRTGSRVEFDDYLAEWADWLADINDSHARFPGLVYLRSSGDLSWSRAALIVMDVAALVEALAPSWAPANARALLDSGSACVQRLTEQLGIVVPAVTVSLQGRENRAFATTMQLVIDSGFEVENDLDRATATFQRARIQYAPHIDLIGARLMACNENTGARR